MISLKLLKIINDLNYNKICSKIEQFIKKNICSSNIEHYNGKYEKY
tara:strand:+ start:723 stop:860 length:138 start_codon:yes stop_codon:yes gene_type:complete